MTIQDKLATANFQLMKADIHIQTMTTEADQLRAHIAELETRVENANIAATSLQIQNAKLVTGNATLTAFNESMQTDADRANLRIIAKDMQISELTRMLFALGKQDGQTIRELTEENRGLRQMLHMEPK